MYQSKMAVRIEGPHVSRSQCTDLPEAPQTSRSFVHLVSISTRSSSIIGKINSCCSHNYRIQCAFSKGALLVLLWGFLTHAFIPFYISVNLLQLMLTYHHKAPESIHKNLYRALFILYPLMGWLADAKIGRYKAIIYSIFSIFIASILMSIGYLIHIYADEQQFSVQIIVMIILSISIAFNLVGFACFDANVIPFLTDQVQGASGEMLSALIHWHFWLSALGEIVNIILTEISSILKSQYFTMTILLIHILLMGIIIVTIAFCEHWLDTTPQITNPIRLIVKVLNYARKNKHPRNRSV